MSEKNITLISKDYAESIFVTGPKFDSLSAFVSGPDAQVQGKLTASTGINLNDNTISVDTATVVGTSNLPVTASAVNTKLGDYATTTDLNNKQDKLSWYSESGSGGMDPYKVDIAANEVTLRAGGDTVGMISENVRLTLSQNYGDKTDIKIETFSDSSASWHNVLSATRYGEISLGDPQTSVYINGRPILVKDEITFEHSVYIQGPIVDNNTNITLIQGKETWDGSGVDQVVIGDGSHSVYINGPLYDKDGNEITGAGGGNYVPLGSYGGSPQYGALPIGETSTASGDYSTASGDYSTASGGYSTAIGYGSTASGYAETTACGNVSTASGDCSMAFGSGSNCLASSSFAIGPYVRNKAGAGGVLGNFVRNSDDSTIVIGTFTGFESEGQFTQLYLIAAGSELSTQYCGGEAGLGYITTQPNQGSYSDNWEILARGTRKLSDLLTDHTTDFTPDLSKPSD